MAKAIASELRVESEEVTGARLDDGEGVLFLGSGCYGGAPGPRMMELIERSDLSGRRVALFGTSGDGKGMALGRMEEALKGKGAIVLGKYSCRGRTFFLINRGHPDEEDLKGAREFARRMCEGK